MLDGMLWILCAGNAWQDISERFGPWSTVSGLAKSRDVRLDAQTPAPEFG